MNDLNIETELALTRLPNCYRVRLRALIANPDMEHWEDSHGIQVGADGWMTLWQAVRRVDPSFPSIGRSTTVDGTVIREWARIPDAILLRDALCYATH